MEGNALRVVTILVVYFAVSGIILASGGLYVVDVAGVNLVPTSVSLLLLVLIYVWYRYHGQREELSEQMREKGKTATLGTILLLFVLAMSVRIASVLLLRIPFEKTAVVYLVVLIIVSLEGTDRTVFGFKTTRFKRALVLGVVYYLLYELSSTLTYYALVFASTDQSIVAGYHLVPFVVTLPCMTFCVGISEEGLFRGCMQTHIRGVYGRSYSLTG